MDSLLSFEGLEGVPVVAARRRVELRDFLDESSVSGGGIGCDLEDIAGVCRVKRAGRGQEEVKEWI